MKIINSGYWICAACLNSFIFNPTISTPEMLRRMNSTGGQVIYVGAACAEFEDENLLKEPCDCCGAGSVMRHKCIIVKV